MFNNGAKIIKVAQCSHLWKRRCSHLWKRLFRYPCLKWGDFLSTKNKNNRRPMLTIQQILKNVTKEAKVTANGCLGKESKVVSLQDILTNDLTEDYVVIGILYRITHARHDSNSDSERQFVYKRQKRLYNRIFMFGGLDGQVFCFVYENENIARTAMDFCRERIGIGQPFAFLEPKFIPRSILKIDQPCLETTAPFITLEDGVIASLPNVICKLPSSPKEERFFHYAGVQVSFHSVELRGKGDIKKPSCGGYLCDRTQPYKVTHACGCFDISEKLSSVVLEYSLKVQLPGLGEGSINFERSLRTTNLFVVSPQSLGILNADERFGEVKKL